jgi:environmental stress-induced protein Ves
MAAPTVTLLDPALYRRTPWKNRGGVTIDIAGAHRPGADPAGWDGIIWRLGRTRIERPGPFSDLAGYDRILAVIEGRGLMLHPRDRTPLDVREPFTPVRFAGEWPIVSDLTDGPVGVLNLIADRTLCAIDLAFPEEGTRITVPAGHAIVLALGGATAEIGGRRIELAPDAAARFDNAAPVEVAAPRGRVAIASIRNRQ